MRRLWNPLAVSVLATVVATGLCSLFTNSHAHAAESGAIVMKTVMVEDEDEEPAAAGKAAGEALKKAMGDTPIKAVLISECFEDREDKEELLVGLREILPAEVLFGGATYGSFTQDGCTDFDAVCLLGIGGEGIGVSARLVTEMGTSKLLPDTDQDEIRTRLHAAGKKLAGSLRRSDRDRLCVVVADAHSPKNQSLVEGLQKGLGKQFPIAGGSANKNAGQTFVYFKGQIHQDAALALLLSGDFRVGLSGRQANQEQQVISTAKDGAQEALDRLDGTPMAVMAFNCAGRRSKLNDYGEELAAMQEALGKELPLFGCYCAGEIGPLDSAEKDTEAVSGGGGWHVMFAIIGK